MYRVSQSRFDAAAVRVEHWFAQNVAPGFFSDGVDAAGPLDVLFARWNGQAATHSGGQTPPFFEAHILLSADAAAEEKHRMDALAQDEDWPSAWWNSSWYPFAADGLGQLLVLDADTGAVLEFIHDDDARPDFGPSLEAFLEGYADELEGGQRVLRDGCIVDIDEWNAAQERKRRKGAKVQAQQVQMERSNRRFFIGLALIVIAVILLYLFR